MTRERDDLADDAVARAWREHMDETPPAAVDDAIRAAAHRAVGAKPRGKPLVAEAREPWRWWMPLAAAATIGAIAIGVIQNLPQDASEPTVVSDLATARRAPPASTTAAAPDASDSRSPGENAVADKAMEAPGRDVARPKSAVEAIGGPTPEQRDRVPLPLPRTEVPRAQAPAAPAPMRQEAAKPGTRERSDAQSETHEGVAAPTLDDKLAPTAPPRMAALGKRADETAQPERKNEADPASGFVASPPPRESVGAAAKQAASAPPSPASPPTAGVLGAAREASEAPGTAGRAKRTVAPEDAPASATQSMGARPRAKAEPEAMAVTPPDVFIAEIRRLLAAGDRPGAVRELQRFRRTHVDADTRLPDDLREFATSVARP